MRGTLALRRQVQRGRVLGTHELEALVGKDR
jgi:hypothetical protein